MPMHFHQPQERESFIRRSGEKSLQVIENHFVDWWPFTIQQQDTLKRFLANEPEGREVLIKSLERNPGVNLQIESYELLPKHDIIGMTLYASHHYVLKEYYRSGFILVEKNTCDLGSLEIF